MVLIHMCPKFQLLSMLMLMMMMMTMTMTMTMTAFVLGVYVKTVSHRRSHDKPTFCLPTLRAALGKTSGRRIPVYPGIRHVLLAKVVHRGLAKP